MPWTVRKQFHVGCDVLVPRPICPFLSVMNKLINQKSRVFFIVFFHFKFVGGKKLLWLCSLPGFRNEPNSKVRQSQEIENFSHKTHVSLPEVTKCSTNIFFVALKLVWKRINPMWLSLSIQVDELSISCHGTSAFVWNQTLENGRIKSRDLWSQGTNNGKLFVLLKSVWTQKQQ